MDNQNKKIEITGYGEVSENVFNLLRQWKFCDLVLDRELSDPFADELAALEVGRVVHRVNPKNAATHIDHCLMLVRLSTRDLPILDESIEISLEQNTSPLRPIRSVGGWLFSKESNSKRIAEWLEKVIIIRIQNSASAVLRIWDPRVIGHIAKILTEEQLYKILGPIEKWAWIDRAGHLRVLDKPAIRDPGSRHSSILLSPEQDLAIERIEYINTLLKAMAGLGYSVAVERDAELDSLVQLAQRKGHFESADVIAYCLHSLLIAPDFDQIPQVRDAIKSVRERGLGLCAALEQFEDNFWEANKLPV
jgi:hypothetical protein